MIWLDGWSLVMVGGALITLSTSSFIQEKREVQVIYACGVDLFCIHFATSSWSSGLPLSSWPTGFQCQAQSPWD